MDGAELNTAEETRQRITPSPPDRARELPTIKQGPNIYLGTQDSQMTKLTQITQINQITQITQITTGFVWVANSRAYTRLIGR